MKLLLPDGRDGGLEYPAFADEPRLNTPQRFLGVVLGEGLPAEFSDPYRILRLQVLGQGVLGEARARLL